MPPAAGLRRSAVMIVALVAALAGCGAGAKKKVAAAESARIEEPMTKWESAGETMPPETPPPAPTPPPAAAAKPATAGPTQASRPAPKAAPGKKVAPPKKEIAKKPPAPTPTRGPGAGSGTQGPAAVHASAAGATAEDDALLTPVLTIENVASAGSPPAAASTPKTVHSDPPPPRKPEPTPAATPPPPASQPPPQPAPQAVAKIEPPPPGPRVEPAPRSEPPPSRPEPQQPHEKAVVTRGPLRPGEARPARPVEDEPPPRELHATIAGKTIVFRDGVILGNRRHGYAFQAFEMRGSTKEGEVDATIETMDLKKRKPLPIKLIYLRILDEGPRSENGVRELTCRGRGELVLDSVPPLPKKLPQDALDVGDAAGNLALEVSCMKDSIEFGSFTIEGRVLFRVVVIPADM